MFRFDKLESKLVLHRIIFLGLCLLLFCQKPLWAQSFSVSPGVVRAFAENTLSVKIEGWDCANMQVRSDNGKIKKIGDCKYLLIPQRVGAVNILVSKVQNGAVIDLGERRLTADGKSVAARATEVVYNSKESTKTPKEVLPLFQVSFNGKMSGELKKRVHFKNKHLDLLCEDSKALEQASINRFRVVLIKGDIMVFEKIIEGDALDAASLMEIVKQKEGCQLLFTGIIVNYRGRQLLVKDIEFDLRS